MDYTPTINLYCRLMEEIKKCTEVIISVEQQTIPVPVIVALELCYLQLRLICETIALGCLVAHGDVVGTQTGRMKKAYEADWILNNLERLHPKFYPIPTKQILGPDGRPKATEHIKSGFLTKKELINLYTSCGEMLHRGSLKNLNSKFERPPDFRPIGEWRTKVITLLNHHQIQLLAKDTQLWVLMKAKDDGRAHGLIMRAVSGPTVLDRK